MLIIHPIIDLIVKLSLLIGLPVAVAIVWKKRSHAHWNSLFFGCGAFAIYYLVQIPLDRVASQLINILADIPILVRGVGGSLPFILQAFVWGTFREVIRWLIFRYAATGVRLWRDGVMFGIGYGSIAMLYQAVSQMLNGFGDESTYPAIDIDFFQDSLIEIMTALNSMFELSWFQVLYWTWRLGVVSMIFHIAMSLIVLFIVQRQDMRLLLLSIVLYFAYLTAPAVMISYARFADLRLFKIWQAQNVIINIELARFFAVLPFLWLIFRLRRHFPNSSDSGSN